MNFRSHDRAMRFQILGASLLLSLGLPVQAATYSLPAGIGSVPFANCSFVSGTTYSCTGNVNIGSNDTVTFTTSMTLQVAGDFTMNNNGNLTGTGYTVNIVAGGNIQIGNSLVSSVNFTAGGNFQAGNSANITGNITAGGDVQIGNNGTIVGDIIAGGNLSLGSGTTVTGSCTPTHPQCSNACSSSTSGYVTTVTCTGNGSFTPPAGVTLVQVEAWGGGGGGGAATGNPAKGGGGAGGQYAMKHSVAVTPGTPYTVVVGAGGAGGTTGNGSTGGNSTFNGTTVVARGGAGGGGATTNGGDGSAGTGSTTGGVGDVVYRGGNGAAGNARSQCNNGGAGGGGAGSGGNGGNASGNTGGSGTATGGGNGGAGSNNSGNGAAGNPYGGGGAGACAESHTDRRGGAGGAGAVVITYTTGTPAPVADYRFDECTQYTGTTGEVQDTIGSYPGTPMGGLQNASPGQVQRYADFSNPRRYVNVPSGPTLTNWTISVWFKKPFATSATHISRYYVLGSVSGGGDFIYLDRNYNYRWGVYTVGSGGGVTNGTFRFGTLTDGWHHLALVGSGNKTILYIDGIYRDWVARQTTGTFRYLGASYDLVGTIFGQSFGTPLDEFKIFNTALYSGQIYSIYTNELAGNNWDGTARASACGLHHLELQHPTGSGLTCAASTLTIQACADAACTSPYTGGVSGSLTGTGVNWDGTTGGASGSGFVIASGSSSVTKNFQPGAAGTVVLGTTGVTPTPGSSTTCNFGSPACTFTANTAGFIFSATTTGDSATIPAQIAGTATGTYYLRAVQASTTNPAVCTPAIVGQSNLPVTLGYTCLDPASCQAGNWLTVNSTAVPATGGSVSLNFDANGSAPITLRYDDVGSIAVTATKTLTPFSGATPVTLNGSTNAFVVKPHHFDLSDIQCGATPNPGAADATGPVFCKAGESFSATVTARNALGGVTPNYGQEATPEGVRLVSTLASGLGLTNDPGISNATAFGSFTGGVATGTTFAWNEVGIITLTPGIGDSDYLGAGDVTGTTSGNVGRFYPDHFELSAESLTPANGTFSYMDQPFNVAFTLTAKALGGDTTTNYVSSATPANNFAKLDPTNTALWPSTTLGGVGFALGARDGTSELSTRLATAVAPTGSWVAGEANISASPQFSRETSPDGPFDALDIGVAPRDADGVTLQTAALDMDADNDSINERKKLGQTKARFGRLWIGNAHGSEQLGLSMPFQTQYWTGTAWTTNILDSTTSLSGLIVTSTSACGSPSVGAISSGKGALSFAAPGSKCSVEVCALLANDADNPITTCQSGASTLPWLQGNWDADGHYNDNPTARATFGIYQGRAPVIYRRERY